MDSFNSNPNQPQKDWFTRHQLFGYVLVAAAIIFFIAWQYKVATYRKSINTDFPAHQTKNPNLNLKSYSNGEFEFKYPDNLTLREDKNKVALNHKIAYKNNGDCDMSFDEQVYEELTDFNLTLEIVSPQVKLNFNDGTFTRGILNGVWVFEGAEYCGETGYYINLENNRTLVIKRANIQALSSGVATWDREEILKVSGVIDTDANEVIFNQIISSFKFIDFNIVKIYSHGGLCQSAQECESTIEIKSTGELYKDGKFVSYLVAKELFDLQDEIGKVNFKAMQSVKFTDVCPIAYDGQEQVYTFYTSESSYKLASCEVKIDNNLPLFKSINTILEKYL